MSSFIQRLEAACNSRNSLLCVGLDPDPERMPVEDIFQFNRGIIDATADLVCAYKPNLAFYEAMGIEGLTALKQTVDYIREVAGEAVIIGDAKRGDIGISAKVYAKAMFQTWGFDAATVNSYGGHDSIIPFLEYPGRGVFIWCRSSNAGAGDLQDAPISDGNEGKLVYQRNAVNAREWNVDGNIGLVMGATYPEELRAVRDLCPEMAFLVPGVGSQGGDLEAAIRWGADSRGRLAIINSSRQIIYASKGSDFAEAARWEAAKLRDQINRVLEGEGKGWS